MLTRPIARFALGAVLLLALIPALSASRAAAATNHAFRPLPPSLFNIPGGFDDACGVAVDPSSRLYVSDYHHDAIDLFGESGLFISRLSHVDPLGGPCGLSLDASGDLYVDDYDHNLTRYSPAGFASGSGTEIDSGHTTGVAVERSSGRVYVDHRTYVAVYEPSGEPVLSEGSPLRIGIDPSADYYGLAVSEAPASAGRVYVADRASGKVLGFDPAVAPQVPALTIDGAGTPQGGFVSLRDAALAVDPDSGHLLVLDNLAPEHEHPAAVIDEFNATGDYRGQLPHAIIDGEPSGLAFGPGGEVFATSGNSSESEVLLFDAGVAGRALRVTLQGSGGGSVKSNPAGIACPPACEAEYEPGAQVTLIASADGHSAFAGWVGCPAPSANQCSVGLAESTEVKADFEALPQQPLSLSTNGPGRVTSAPAGLSCPPECAAQFNEGSDVLLRAEHDERAAFLGWSGCDAESQGECEVALDSPRQVSASFTPIPQAELSVTLSGAGVGLVKGDTPGPDFSAIACGAECQASYNQGASILLTALPSPGSKFAGWGGCDSQPDADHCLVALGTDRQITAHFEPTPNFTLQVKSKGNGSGLITSAPLGLACPPGCSLSAPEGSTFLLRAAPNPGSSFVGWSGGCAGSGNCTVTLDSDTTVYAEFTVPPEPVSPAPLRLSLGRFRSSPSGRSGRLAVNAPASGELLVRGKLTRATHRRLRAAGKYSVALRLDRAGRLALANAPHHRLSTEIVVSLTPFGQTKSIATKRSVTFQRAASGRGSASILAHGPLFVSLRGAISPRALPRHRLAPITLSFQSQIRSPQDGAASLRHIEIAVNRHGRLDTEGLPTCSRAQLRSTSNAAALAACRSALVGQGRFAAHVDLSGQVSFPSRGRILAFNSRHHGRPSILVHVYGTQPFAITRLIYFDIRHTGGPFGLVLSAQIPSAANERSSIRFIGLSLHRTFSAAGRRHSFLSASCPVPPGIARAPFALARASMGFSDGRMLTGTLERDCEALP